MPVAITHMNSFHERKVYSSQATGKRSVEELAANVLLPVLMETGRDFSHLVAATSCPDSIAPSLGQCINDRFHEHFKHSITYDLVQGCAGGVSALVLAFELAQINRSSIAVVTADAAQKATYTGSDIYPIFSNGAFACVIEYGVSGGGLLKSLSHQYKDLYEVVTIRLGHDADMIIQSNISDMSVDPRKHLGLSMNNRMAVRLMQKAEQFFLDFIEGGPAPEVLLLHQVNPMIIAHLQNVFSKYPVRFINYAEEIRNCGAATTGVVLHKIWMSIIGKKVMICSFGTGGVISAGLWQF